MIHFAGKTGKVLLLSTLLALLLAVSASAADLATAVGATTGSALRMRAGASTSSSVVTTLDKHVAVAVHGDAQNGWYHVSYDGKTGYISSDFLVIDQNNLFRTYGRLNGAGVNVRAAASLESQPLTCLPEGALVTVTGFQNGWYAVTCANGVTGYVRSDYVDLTSSAASTSSSAIANTAKKYMGTRYVYGGASPSGFDCSGFTMYVYRQHGHALPHSASAQWQSNVGNRVYSASALQSGDLVFFNDPSRNAGKACSHAGIYLGDGNFIHASSSRSGGVKVSNLNSGYYHQYFVGGRHV